MTSMEEKQDNAMADMLTELSRRENLIRNLAHEIRTPVTVIKGYAESLAVLYPENKKIHNYTATIVEECDRLNEMSKNMLALCHIRGGADSYEKKEVAAQDLFEEFQARIRNSIPYRDIKLRCDPADLNVNVFLIERAVYNLIANAIRYGDRDAPVTVTGEVRGDDYYFIVENDGPEIMEEDLAYIWDAFYKTDKSRKRSKGYGIGLAIVKETALLHGGSVHADSRDRHTTLAFSVRMDREVPV